MRHQWVVAPLLVLLVRSAAAEIYEWRDADGNRHFTNSMSQVPSEQRGDVQVIVPELPVQVVAAGGERREPVPPCPPPEEHVAPAQVETIYDHSAYREAYADGIRDTMAALAGGVAPEAVGTVQINGPLAVNNTSGGGGPYGGFDAFPWYYPFVTTAFDRGRSRFLTLRLLLQDQFQLDRDGPFAFERFPQVGVGPGLDPFLPRGLNPPHYHLDGSRVLFR